MLTGLGLGLFLLTGTPVLAVMLEPTIASLVGSLACGALGSVATAVSFGFLLRRSCRWISRRVGSDVLRASQSTVRALDNRDGIARLKSIERQLKKGGSVSDVLRRVSAAERRVVAAVDTSLLDGCDEFRDYTSGIRGTGVPVDRDI